MDRALCAGAHVGLTASGYEDCPGYCERWVRQVVEAVYGMPYHWFFKVRAKWGLVVLQVAGYRVARAAEPGDIVGHRRGKYGHVAIAIEGGMMAENSTAHGGDGKGGRGIRPLTALGDGYEVYCLAKQARGAP